MGTRIDGLPVVKVVDGDTIHVDREGGVEKLRLIALDTEESLSGSGKPVTNAGKLASEMAKKYFNAGGGGPTLIDLEFDTDDPVDVCLEKHRGNYGRLICYVHKGGENFTLKAVREGWSPYFFKYGRSRQLDRELSRAEAEAQAHRRVIWDPETNAGGPSRDYHRLLPWWAARAALVKGYRAEGAAAGALSVRLDHQRIVAAAQDGENITVFCDLQAGISKRPSDGAVIFAGSKFHKFNLWIPDTNSSTGQLIIRLIETRYAGQGRGYVYVTGEASLFRGIPQIVLEDVAQLSDFALSA